MAKTLFKPKTHKSFAAKPLQIRVYPENLEEILSIPNWQDKFREMLPEIIERMKEV